MERPDLTDVPEAVVDYIAYLEKSLLEKVGTEPATPEPRLAEEPTTINVITISSDGFVKRTPRHFYHPQRRGGMGNFDLEVGEDEYPAQLVVADEESELIVVTTFARVFRLPVSRIAERPVRSRGEPLRDLLTLHEREEIVTVLGGRGEYIVLLSPRGYVFTKNKHYLRDGAQLYDVKQHGSPIAACWSTGDDDLFVISEKGIGIRFWVKQVPDRGCLAMRLNEGDRFWGVTAASEDGAVFMISHDGKGTIREMAGFRKNKAPGAGGKVAIKTERLAFASSVDAKADLFVISQLGKIIRFGAADIPFKTGVVQGVNCMALRSDEVCAAAVSSAT